MCEFAAIPEVLRMVLENLNVFTREPLRLVCRDWDLLIRDIQLNQLSVVENQVNRGTLHLFWRGAANPNFLSCAENQKEFNAMIHYIGVRESEKPYIQRNRFRDIARWMSWFTPKIVGMRPEDWLLWALSQETPRTIRAVLETYEGRMDPSKALRMVDYCIPTLGGVAYVGACIGLYDLFNSMGIMVSRTDIDIIILLSRPHWACIAAYSWYESNLANLTGLKMLRNSTRLGIDSTGPGELIEYIRKHRGPRDHKSLEEIKKILDRNWDQWIGRHLKDTHIRRRRHFSL